MNVLKSLIKKSPKLYNQFQKTYYYFRRILETHIFGTKIQEWIWKTRHIYKGKDWIKGYINSINHPHRHFLIEKLESKMPFESALEIGCNAGPNLYLLAMKYPEIRFYGIDINYSAIREGQKWFKLNDIKNVILFPGKADKILQFKDKSVDLTFTDAAIMFIGPDKIKQVLGEMIRITSKAIILYEFHNENQKIFYLDGRWVYNYKFLFGEFSQIKFIKISKIPDERDAAYKNYCYIIEVGV